MKHYTLLAVIGLTATVLSTSSVMAADKTDKVRVYIVGAY